MRIIKKHQTLADFVAQHAGSMNAMFEVALLNNISISTQPRPGTDLFVNVNDIGVATYYIKSGLDIAGPYSIPKIAPGGIGYMQIQNDFKVS